jgi:hypothetical protein
MFLKIEQLLTHYEYLSSSLSPSAPIDAATLEVVSRC